MKKIKIRSSILVTLTAMVCSIGFQQITDMVLTKYEKGCWFMLMWLCMKQIADD